MQDLIRRFWPYFSIAFVVLLFFWKFFIKGLIPLPADFVVGVYYPWLDYKWGYSTGVPVKNPMTTDVVSLIYPEQILGNELIKSGHWPLWNPYILTGTPLLANLQTASFSPTSFLYYLFDKLDAWSWQIIISHVLAALFTFFLLRHWRLSKFASVLGGLIFTFSGFNLIFSQWNGHTLTSAFIPLILLLMDKFLEKGKLSDGAYLSFAIGFQLLSGYPQTCLYTAFAMVLLWLFRFKQKQAFFKRSFYITVFSILGIGLAAVQLLPARELWGLSQRDFEPHPYEWAFLPYKKVITFVAPDYFGNHATQNYWGPQDYTSNTAYIGVVGAILAMLSLAFAKKKKEVLFLMSLAFISLILSFATPLSTFLWENNVFGMRAASAHRATVLFAFAGSALAAFGFDVLSQARKKATLIKGLIPVFILLVFFALYAISKNNEIVRGIAITKVALRNLVLPSTVFFASAFVALFLKRLKYLLLALSVFELFYFGWKFTPFSEKRLVFPTTPVLDFLIMQEGQFRVTGNRVIPVNMRTPYKLESLEGYETIHPLRISQFLAALNSQTTGTNPVGRYGTVDNDTSPLLDLVNTKYYLVHNLDEKGNPFPNGKIPDRFDTERFSEVFRDKSVTIMESKSALPRSFFVEKWEIINDDVKILGKLLDPAFDFSKTLILEEEPPKGTKGFIFTSDAFYPGWRAFVNGVETKIYRADFAFRAVPVESKESKISYEYAPNSFYLGLKVSLAVLTILTLSLLTKRFLR